MTLPDTELARRKAIMLRNADALAKRVPTSLEKEQRGLTREIQRRQYADNNVKSLGLLYDYLERVMALSKGLVACKRGCSTCCHSEIALYQPEADFIAAKTGLPVRQIPQDPARRTTPYATTKAPCPFLHDGACSIYAHRPLVCRTLVNFDADNTVCQFEHRDNTPIPMIDRASTFSGVFEAYYNVIVPRNGGGAGDIREFFGEVIHQRN